ncbi:MAG: 50S ribosomal protein L35 [Nitrospirae bacterium]|nr:MAG: 50S ribosomal protein L35 [Nitrospirota bacterium]
MPKLKTHRGAAKRFKITSSGKIKRKRACLSHLLTGKSSKRTRRLRQATYVDKADYKTIRKLIPYM